MDLMNVRAARSVRGAARFSLAGPLVVPDSSRTRADTAKGRGAWMMSTSHRPILAVDDSAPIREMIISVLSSKGYQVTPAADGHQALQRLRSAAEPYIVLLDIVMPLMDGIAVVNAVAADDALRGMGHRFVLMSSSVRMSQPDVPATAGQLAKPFTRQQLIEMIETLENAP